MIRYPYTESHQAPPPGGMLKKDGKNGYMLEAACPSDTPIDFIDPRETGLWVGFISFRFICALVRDLCDGVLFYLLKLITSPPLFEL